MKLTACSERTESDVDMVCFRSGLSGEVIFLSADCRDTKYVNFSEESGSAMDQTRLICVARGREE